jgi:hypothetical protein
MFNINMQQKNLEQQQINKQAAQEEQMRAMKTQALLASFQVSAGESGISGASVDRGANEIVGASEQDIAAMEGNRKTAIDQAQLQAKGSRAGSQSTINQNRSPGALGVGLQIAGAAGQATGAYYEAKNPSTKNSTTKKNSLTIP